MRQTVRKITKWAVISACIVSLAGCSGSGGGFFGRLKLAEASPDTIDRTPPRFRDKSGKKTSLLSLFRDGDDPNTTVEVNKYLWQASLEVLNFLPIESVDPFSGVIVTGFGTPPGGGRAYRATVYVQDPALDARSLKVSLKTKGGAVDAATQRAVEDAILTRARQLRIRDSNL
ncbi:MAG: DUF3576 domain-containing protein [Paracoccaceae bacterium]